MKNVQRKRRKKRKKSKEGTIETTEGNNWKQKDFLSSPRTEDIKEKTSDDFIFSDYENEGVGSKNDDKESDVDHTHFVDSRETLSADESSNLMDNFTPVNRKSAFARTLSRHAESVSKPTSSSTPSSTKRSASSPADAKEQKKSRAQSRSRSLKPTKN